MPLPAKLLEQGVRDMVRICDGRMSGTAYGTVVLHVSPEAAAGGPLGLVGPATSSCSTCRPGGSTSTSPRGAGGPAPDTPHDAGFAAPTRGWERLYVDHVSRPTPAPTSTSWSAPAAGSHPRVALTARSWPPGIAWCVPAPGPRYGLGRPPAHGRGRRRVGRVRSGRRVWRAASRRSPGSRRTRRANGAPRGEVQART